MVRHESGEDRIAAHKAFPNLVKRGIKEVLTQTVIQRKVKRFPCPHCSQKTFTREFIYSSGPMMCPECRGSVGFSPASKLVYFVAFVAPASLLLLAYFTTDFSGFLEDLGIGGRGAKALVFGSLGVGGLLAHTVSGIWIGLVKR